MTLNSVLSTYHHCWNLTHQEGMTGDGQGWVVPTSQGSGRDRKAVGVLQVLSLPRPTGMVGSDRALSPVPGHFTGKILACLSPTPLPHPSTDRLGRQGASLWPHGDRSVTPACGLWDRNCTSLSPPWLVSGSSKMVSDPVCISGQPCLSQP